MEPKTTIDLDIPESAEDRQCAEYHAWQFFKYDHLPKHLQDVSKPFSELARTMLLGLPKNPETTKMLNKILEAKDCAVRALLAKK